MTESRRDAELVTAVVGVANALDLAVTAEGIETAEQYELLLQAGCHEGQGYYLAKPMAADVASGRCVASAWTT